VTAENHWHRRPKGKGPCSICGCPSTIRAIHRTTTDKEKANQTDPTTGRGYDWLCYYVMGYGMDSEDAFVQSDGLKERDVAWTDPEAPPIPEDWRREA